MKRPVNARSWRRLIADLMIVGGLLVLLYPAGTWGYARWQQSRLEAKLVASDPVFQAPPADFFQGLTPTATADRVGVAADQKAKRQALLADLERAADAFEASLGDKQGVPLGKIRIPKIGVEQVLIQGTGKSDLREGPGHWPGTPFPGQGGNFVVSGHRTTYGAPFFRLDRLRVGDTIDVLMPYAALRYKVTRSVIVLPTQVEEVRQRGFEQISLATCHPIYSAKQRLVIQADLDSFRLLGRATTQTGTTAGS